MLVVDIDNGTPSPARTLIDPWPYGDTTAFRTYEVLEDGSFITTSFVGLGQGQSSGLGEEWDELGITELQVVLNFHELLRKRMAR